VPNDTQTAALLARAASAARAYSEIRAVIGERFEAAPTDAYCVRRQDVVQAVCQALRWTNNRVVCAQVAAIAASLGWALARPGNRKIFVGVRHRGAGDRAALTYSQEIRRWAHTGGRPPSPPACRRSGTDD
jgi:hypothetical protein